MKTLRKIFLLCCLLFSLLGYSNAAGSADSFSVEVKENFNLGEAVDFSIIAIKDGDVFKEYSGMVFIWIKESNGNYLDDDYYVVSNEGRYQFLATDQGQKTFSKGLQITKAGTYILQIEDPSEGGKGEATIVVDGDTKKTEIESISITYPISSSIETKSFVTVLGSCEKLKNSPVMLYLNNNLVSSGYTDAKGDFSIVVGDLLSGDNEIQAKIVDINNVVLGESAVISVKYQSPQDGVFNSIEILPSKNGKQGDKMVFNVSTDDSVSSAQLLFSNGLKYSMDRVGQGLFSKEIEVTFFGDIDISVSLVENGNEKIYENIDMIEIEENISISNIKFTSTGLDGSQVVVSWDTIGSVSKYQINYGTARNNLSNSQTVSSSTVLIENLNKDTTYFFQIIPMDEESHNSGDPSEIVEYFLTAVPCVVKGIKLTTEQIGDNYYLVWDPVENVTSYEVYKSDWADMTDARLVGNLTGTRFQYIFDKNADKDEYAYYQVQAICPDGTSIIVDQAQKVKVGPLENMLLIIVISVFVYSLYRLNKISDKEF